MIINNLITYLDGVYGLYNHVKIVNKTFRYSCVHLKFRLVDKWNTELKNGTLS